MPVTPPRRRLRPTFLSQVVFLLAGLGVLGALVLLVEGRPLSVAAVVLLFCWVALEVEALPRLIEWAVSRRANRAPVVSSRWFVDVEAEEQEARARARREVEDNPAIG